MGRRICSAIVLVGLLVLLGDVPPVAAQSGLSIGLIDPRTPAEPTQRNAAVLEFAQSQGKVMRLRPHPSGGWQVDPTWIRAPEEFDVIWYHQGDDPAAVALPEAVINDLRDYLELGGSLLLSGAAGQLVNSLDLETTPLRVLGPAPDAYLTGLIVRPEQRDHPAFAGLDTSKPILLTSLGANALADFYDTEGPHGTLLADGNVGLGERPLVEYTSGAGRVIVVGWRLPDFTTAEDPHRPNLERLFANLLKYLADRNTNRARPVTIPGESSYTRILGIPFLRVKEVVDLMTPQAVPGEKAMVVLTTQPAGDKSLAADGLYLSEREAQGESVRVQTVGITLLTRSKSTAEFIEARKAEQRAAEEKERERIKGLKVLKPEVKLLPGPLKPLKTPELEQSVLLGRSPFMAPGDGKGDIRPVYEPIEDGGFRIAGSQRQLNRMIVHGQNRLWTGDVPLFRMDTGTGNASYAADRIYPLWPREDSQAGQAMPSMGTLRIGVPGTDGKPQWLDELPDTVATFRPGYTEYDISGPAGAWKARVEVAPSMEGHGLICRVAFDRPTPLVWQYGGIWWLAQEDNANKVEIAGGVAKITEANLPNGLVLAGWDGQGEGKTLTATYGQQAEFSTKTPAKVYHIVALWGVTTHDEKLAKDTAARLDTPAASSWAQVRDRLKEKWLDCFVRAALDPQNRFEKLMKSPGAELDRTREHWDRRRKAFQIHTPDSHLNALINWERCRSEYHRKGPGLYLGEIWQMYSHISTGWYGKSWGGDHEAIGDCLRLYGAMRGDDGFIRWISPSLMPFVAENNTPYWVDQVWWHYAWTGDKQFVADLWPIVRKAVEWQRKKNDPDGDGLFQDWYEYWNCDSNGKGPKAAAPSAMSWAMLDRAAKLAEVVGDAKAAGEYRELADKTSDAVFRELWREDAGRLGCIGGEGIWRGHPQIWEEYLAINAGLLSPQQGRRAMRWLASHYGFEPQPGVRLLACSDWFPIRWSTQWVPTGDTCLAAMAGMKSGDVDLWYPFLKTAVTSAYKSEFPGINMGISNAGAGGGDREDVDSVDPYVHVAVRGLFGIEPAMHEGRIDICPAFPADWREASISTPDVSYVYRRDGDKATFRIRTPRPVVKRVRANLTGREAVTAAESESLVTVEVGPAVEPPGPPTHPPTILHEQQPPSEADVGLPLKPEERGRQVLFDLSGVFNMTSEEMTAAKFYYDYQGGPGIPGVWTGNPHPIEGWWGNPALKMPPSSKVVEAATGVLFLTAGRPRSGTGDVPKNMLVLSSWAPNALPGGAAIPVGFKCRRLWLLLQNYVHPMKNYVVNGEIVLKYADGTEHIESLVPPFNLDCYFQHFSRKGTPVPMGRLGPARFIHSGMLFAHADALEVACDPAKTLQTLEFRATCSEGVLGLVGVTAVGE